MGFEQIEIWHYLVAGAFLFFIIEIFTSGFIAGSVGVGFVFAAVVAFFGGTVQWRIALFSIGVATSFFSIKPIMDRIMAKSSQVKTNVDALVGKTGKVVQEINGENETGRVKIDGDDWKAASIDNSIIEKGTSVEVVKLDSIILIVKKSVNSVNIK